MQDYYYKNNSLKKANPYGNFADIDKNIKGDLSLYDEPVILITDKNNIMKAQYNLNKAGI